MFIRNTLVVLSSILMIVAIIPYLVDVIKNKTKPRIMSWLIWSILTGIACVASFSDKQYPTAIMLLLSSMITMSVVILGWKRGSKKIVLLDKICLLGAIIGIILWMKFNSPDMAVIATIGIDSIGLIPTVVHSWKKPNEETWSTFVISLVAAVLTLLTVTEWGITAFAYPAYIVFANLTIALVIIFRKRLKA